MAEMTTQPSGRDGRTRAKKLSTRIDMTPMVDLAFLLLTFFMLSTTLRQSNAMELLMPEKSNGPALSPPIHPRHVLTLVLGEQNKLYWYAGETADSLRHTTYARLRKVLAARGNDPRHWVFVKPADSSTYQNLVDAFDELAIANVQRYSLAELSPAEVAFLKH